MINKYFKYPVIEAVELFSAGFCNLNCTYCYIPKTPMLKELHGAILEKIKSGQFLKELKELYGEDLTSIAHWGTEPTLTIRQFGSFYKEALNAFPKLKTISLSSNFMTNPENLVKFIVEDMANERPIDFKIQVSIDGPPWITDKNRGAGNTDLIIKHALEATKEINNLNKTHAVHFHVKPTIGKDDILVLSELDKLIEYYQFFDEFFVKWFEQISNNKISVSNLCDPTVVLPYNYSTEDGINFGQIVKHQVQLQKNAYKKIAAPESNYYGRISQKLKVFKEFFTKQKMFTCSAGDSMVSLSEKPFTLQPCHRLFFADHPSYEQSSKDHGLDELTMKGLELGRNQLLLDINKCDLTNELSTLRMLYNNRVYNDFTKHRYSSGVAIAMELARAGQISDCYKDEYRAYLLTMLIQTTDCPMDDIITSGSALIPALPMFRLFGNGAGENIFSRLLRSN